MGSNPFRMSRVIIFTGRMETMASFYADVLGLEIVDREPGWVELRAGDCAIALHEWHGEAGEGPLKIVFHADDVRAARDEILSRGGELGDIVSFGSIDLCDGRDPDGNAIQLSSRRTPHQMRSGADD